MLPTNWNWKENVNTATIFIQQYVNKKFYSKTWSHDDRYKYHYIYVRFEIRPEGCQRSTKTSHSTNECKNEKIFYSGFNEQARKIKPQNERKMFINLFLKNCSINIT